MLRQKCRAAALCGLVALSFPVHSSAAEVKSFTSKDLTVISVVGRLELGDDEKLTRALLEAKESLVMLDSPGGVLSVGLSMGRAIQIRGVPTWVEDGKRCASACGLAWLGGAVRYVEGSGKVGFHAAYFIGDDGKPLATGTGNALIGSYLSKLGLSDNAIFYATRAAPAEMQWLTPEDANRLGIHVKWIDPIVPSADNPSVSTAPPAAPPPPPISQPTPQIATPEPAPPAPVVPAPAPAVVAPGPAPALPQQTPSQTVLAPLFNPAPPAARNPVCQVDDVRVPDDWLSLRSEPGGEAGRRLRKMKRGETFEMLGPRQGDWYLVRTPNGERGWVSWEVRRWISC